MSGEFKKLDTTYFDEAISKFNNAIETYRTARVRVFDTTEAMLFKWEGHGKKRYQTEYDKLKTVLKDEEENLRVYAQELSESLQVYVDWDAEVASNIAK